jgi:hypothetical protein
MARTLRENSSPLQCVKTTSNKKSTILNDELWVQQFLVAHGGITRERSNNPFEFFARHDLESLDEVLPSPSIQQ